MLHDLQNEPGSNKPLKKEERVFSYISKYQMAILLLYEIHQKLMTFPENTPTYHNEACSSTFSS